MKDNYTILVAEDAKINREILEQELTRAGYSVVSAVNGQEALEKLTKGIDLVILDIIMPGLDGYEVARRIRSNPDTMALPVIMITALHTVEDRVAGIEAGADDFITKPFNSLELTARVRALLRISQYYRQLKDSNETINRLQQMKDDLMEMVIHDTGDLLTLIISYLKEIEAKTADEKVLVYAKKALNSSSELRNMRDNLLDIKRMEEGKLQVKRESVDLESLVKEIVSQFDLLINQRRQTVQANLAQSVVQADRPLLKRIMQNLLLNALKHNPEGTTVEIGAERKGGAVTAYIRDNGRGIPREVQEKIFEKFAQADLIQMGYKYGKGLGLTFCKLAVEAHNGKIWVESAPEQGSRFVFELPD